ncbi:MAG: BMP family ABC transporter substrate-binding protein [Intrasporangium sp.]|uniref:BMP family lipoprotein n=1 Tax=Intrasporangium sp. TaxID=1925024 RepID=UPI0026498979|nr:BMP family ABC transporter substrate-binding protein [Intrasporangium sp.]MDN5796271.1 BMP family ABC transporter substrate-binding protein [Intrasporangium sp.]
MRHATQVAAIVAAAALGLAACGSSDTPSSGGTADGTQPAAAGDKPLMVGMAYDVGGRGDQSFNDAAAKGLDKAKAELGVKGQDAAATNGEPESAREERLQQLIDAGYDNIVAVGFAYAPAVKKVAAAEKDVKFALVDSTDAQGPNIENITFAENEGSFLVGAAAALKTKTNHIGFIGGVETPLIKKFEVGYIAGAKKVDPDLKIDVKYLTQPPDFSGFSSVDKGKAAAEGMYQQGADIVYHAAGGSGGGVFQAAKAAGKWAIGVDSDQALTADAAVRDVILTSMIKRVDIGVFDFISSVKDGTFTPGEKVFDLKAGGVDFSTTGGHVDDIKGKLDDFKQQIISGEIKVPSA